LEVSLRVKGGAFEARQIHTSSLAQHSWRLGTRRILLVYHHRAGGFTPGRRERDARIKTEQKKSIFNTAGPACHQLPDGFLPLHTQSK
jgi:hypothetical protein